MRICVVGAGISGISVAKMLHKKHHVTIFEKSSLPGGLIKCTRENGNLFHRVGGHVFNSKNEKVLDWFWRQFNKENEFRMTSRNARIYMDNKYFGYPIENSIYRFPPEIVGKIISELIKGKETYSYANFADFLKGTFGPTLFEHYFRPYNSKLWNTELENIPLDWLEGKLPMPNVKEILLNNILRRGETDMVHSTFFYPKENGSQFIINRLSKDLNIVCNAEVEKIEMRSTGGWLVNSTDYFDKIIYTGDIRTLNTKLSIKESKLKNNLLSAASFISNGTSNALCYTDQTEISWLYFPEAKYRAHRIIYTGNFSPSNNASERDTCVVEFSGQVKEKDILNELEKMPGNLTPIAFNYEPNSYVINTFGTRQIVESIKTDLSQQGFYLLGRFAEWQYYNMDKCIEAAFDIVDGIMIDDK